MSGALQFDADRHRYELDGRRLPGVTEVLDPYTGLDYVNRATLEAARELGTQVHTAIHLHSTGRLAHCPEHVRPYLDAWELFLDESGAVVIGSEIRVYSEKHRFAGTLDNILYWKDSYVLTDVKSGSTVPRTVGPQTASYVQAYNELTGSRLRARRCIHLRGDGTYKVHKLTATHDWNVFQAALTVYRWHRGEL